MSFVRLRSSLLLLCCILCGALTSCLKEKALSVVVDFEYTLDGEFNTTPVTIIIENHTTGADQFEWTFEGGKPASSSDKNPGKVTFTTPGDHMITLRAWNHDLDDRQQVIVRVDSAVTVDFGYQILVNDFAPALVSFTNRTRGAGIYEWTFEGGTPATSTLASPGTVQFDTEGAHRITLKVSNGSETFTTEQTVTLTPTLLPDFTMVPSVDSEDMEAPLTAIVQNASRSSLSVAWQCPGGEIADPSAEQTTVRFTQPGTYTVTMIADNLKEKKSAQQQITVKPNSGLYTLTDMRLGISQAKNTVGCFFSADLQRVLTSNEIASANIGAVIDIGFFALNSMFDYCYFFSPDDAAESAFAAIPGAISTQVNNNSGNIITPASFELITTSADMNPYIFAPGTGTGSSNDSDYFTQGQLPAFVFFRTQDGRRGIIMVKEAIGVGAASYITADIKIEKRIR